MLRGLRQHSTRGDAKATEELLPLVYEERRALAAQKMAQEKPRQRPGNTEACHLLLSAFDNKDLLAFYLPRAMLPADDSWRSSSRLDASEHSKPYTLEVSTSN